MLASYNKLLTDVTPGAPMHRAFKKYWHPVMHASRLEADGAPNRFTLLCEKYVAFRATDGSVGVFDEFCPHRRCSLALAQNRDNALTCLFHGWKFHVSGKCIETPNEPNPEFAARVPLKSFPVREAGGVIWTYVGEGEPPRFSDYIFNQLDGEQLLPRAAKVACGWLQGLEAQIDPAHFAILHQNWTEKAPDDSFNPDLKLSSDVPEMRVEFEETGWGFRFAAIRELPENRRYVRITEYVAPASAFVSSMNRTRKIFILTVPVDNNHSIQWFFWYNPLGPITDEVRSYVLGNSDPDDSDMFKAAKALPMWGQDRQAMKADRNFTGFNDIVIEDLVVQESMGPDVDRTRELLCSADEPIIRARRFILKNLERFDQGDDTAFTHSTDFEYGALEGAAVKLDADKDWRAEARRLMEERAHRVSRTYS